MYRLTENIYTLDDKGVLRLMGRVSVPEHDFSVRGGDVFVRGDRDVFYAVGVDGDHPRYTLTQHEDPMHENCGPCEAGLPEEMHSAPETKLKTVAKAILITLAAAVAAAFMRMC